MDSSAPQEYSSNSHQLDRVYNYLSTHVPSDRKSSLFTKFVSSLGTHVARSDPIELSRYITQFTAQLPTIADCRKSKLHWDNVSSSLEECTHGDLLSSRLSCVVHDFNGIELLLAGFIDDDNELWVSGYHVMDFMLNVRLAHDIIVDNHISPFIFYSIHSMLNKCNPSARGKIIERKLEARSYDMYFKSVKAGSASVKLAGHNITTFICEYYFLPLKKIIDIFAREDGILMNLPIGLDIEFFFRRIIESKCDVALNYSHVDRESDPFDYFHKLATDLHTEQPERDKKPDTTLTFWGNKRSVTWNSKYRRCFEGVTCGGRCTPS